MRTFSFGGGVQSTAVLALVADGTLQYDHLLFSNVGDDSEHPATIKYVNEYAIPFAQKHNIDLHVLQRIPQKGPQKGIPETLYGRLTKPDSRSLPIPVRMSDTGAPGTRSCTADFKIRVIARWLKEHGASPNNPAVTGLGISVDEIHRARTDSGFAYQTLEYPLIELGIRRSDCRDIIVGAGLPMPPRSACWFCPYHTPAEWTRMRREEPELFQQSVALERLLNERRAMLGKDPVWFTRFGRPLDQVIADQPSLFDDDDDTDRCESGHCFI